jgi:hypothetical protein
MRFGDRVVLLRWLGKGRGVQAFAAMTITNLILERSISEQVCRDLEAEGRAEYSEGGGLVQRECGFYISLGSWSVKAEISEIMDSAIKVAEKDGKEAFAMIGGRLTEIYETPILLSPAPKFTRGFIRDNSLTQFGSDAVDARNVVSIKDYRKNESPRRRRQALAPV